MHTSTYPGKGLTLPQLVFALNEELKRAVYSPSYVVDGHQLIEGRSADLRAHSVTLDVVSQLDRDTSTALAAVRGWRNSFAHINRIPMDALSLIPLYLTQKDRLRATFVSPLA